MLCVLIALLGVPLKGGLTSLIKLQGESHLLFFEFANGGVLELDDSLVVLLHVPSYFLYMICLFRL